MIVTPCASLRQTVRVSAVALLCTMIVASVMVVGRAMVAGTVLPYVTHLIAQKRRLMAVPMARPVTMIPRLQSMMEAARMLLIPTTARVHVSLDSTNAAFVEAVGQHGPMIAPVRASLAMTVRVSAAVQRRSIVRVSAAVLQS